MSAEEVADRLAITDKIYRYCRAVDRLDVPLGHSIFHPDSHASFPTYEGPGRGWIDAVCVAHLNFLHHSHQVTNVILEIDGDRAGSEAYVTATLRAREGERIVQREFWARYVDAWSRRDGEWAIDRRECVVDFDSVRDVTPIGGGVRARRDLGDPSYAVLTQCAEGR
jgi:hypothetical protein